MHVHICTRPEANWRVPRHVFKGVWAYLLLFMVAEAILTVFFPISVMENYCQREGTLCAPHISRVCNSLLGGLPTTFMLTVLQGGERERAARPPRPVRWRTTTPYSFNLHLTLTATLWCSILINPIVKMRTMESKEVTHHAQISELVRVRAG